MTSLYIHIPFCKKKCNYCDFVSYAGKEDLVDDYIEALCKEVPLRLETGDSRLETVYFGGGTPTLLGPKHFEQIFSKLVISNSKLEISLETNPSTADKTKLKELRQLGINRLSMGAQTFSDQHLKVLGRIHNSKDIFKFYDDARAAGFENINLDLIFALPDQTLDQWKKDLQTAISLNPNHLSTYNLQIEEGTPLWEMTKSQASNSKQIPNPKSQLPNEEEELAMYEFALEALTSAGFNHYEISNFARPGFECQHNINYWKNGNYIGIGAGAHSHINGKRWANPNIIEDYLEAAGRKTQDDSHDTTDQRETIFMGLRLLEGLPHENFHSFEKELADLTESGLLTKENSHVKLTRKGLYLANLVFEKFV